MRIVLSAGERVVVTFEGTDGEITVTFGDGGSLVRVEADLPDSSGREGVIYEEDESPEGKARRARLEEAEADERAFAADRAAAQNEVWSEPGSFLDHEVDHEARDRDDLPEDDE